MSIPTVTAVVNVVPEEVTTIVEREKITLTLDRKVAETLRFLCNEVVGSLEASRRKHTYAVWNALRQAGVTTPHAQVRYCSDRIRFDHEDNL